MPPIVIALSAALCAAAAASLIGRARRIAASDSPWLRPWVAGLLGAVGGASAAAVTEHWAVTAALCALAIGCALLVPVDQAVLRLPDAIVWPTTGAVLAMLLVAAGVTGEWGRLGTAVLAMLAVGAGYFVLAFISPTSLGLGDVKLSLVLGLTLGWFGWPAVLLGVLGGFLVFALAALGLLVARRTTMQAELPFGPWMILGAALGLAWVTVGG
ncbi:prepilin peptidase [Agrococcus jenensis]|uniref:Leader peptidase (Prepilin peptidase)/N-methyltransferase n=1 Tax=Agrococcus jenensis TaxID=46353 RepID=A0A3N2ATX6_9MICO|nr:prepilin peptidase [Agrococcus jenensis]ROR66420.1 leader peptidase (prepilin peptidase)/N-methyltransferase [Agrococcus jenensis]